MLVSEMGRAREWNDGSPEGGQERACWLDVWIALTGDAVRSVMSVAAAGRRIDHGVIE
jgi:hypothetical protein